MRNTRFRHHRIAAITLLAAIIGLTVACGGTGTANSGDNTLTVYSADGLGSWYKTEFAKFTEQTGISVNIVEAGSGEVVSRVQKEPVSYTHLTLPTTPYV